MAFTECDLVIAIGARFDDRVTGRIDGFAPHARIIHIDMDPAVISKNVKVHIPMVGDAKIVTKQLYDATAARERNGWNEHIEEMRKEHPVSYNKNSGTLKPQFVIEKIHEITKGEAVITTEVGQNQMWAALHYKFEKPRNFITSGGLGTMGYGFPAAIGAKIGRPDDIVFDIAGDGSFQMNVQELATAVQHNIGVKVAILNNQYLGMVRQWQELFFNKRYSGTCIECQPDFVKLAEAYGACGIRVDKQEDVESAIIKAIETDGPVIMDFRIDREENVWPMVAPGAPLYDIMEG